MWIWKCMMEFKGEINGFVARLFFSSLSSLSKKHCLPFFSTSSCMERERRRIICMLWISLQRFQEYLKPWVQSSGRWWFSLIAVRMLATPYNKNCQSMASLVKLITWHGLPYALPCSKCFVRDFHGCLIEHSFCPILRWHQWSHIQFESSTCLSIHTPHHGNSCT